MRGCRPWVWKPDFPPPAKRCANAVRNRLTPRHTAHTALYRGRLQYPAPRPVRRRLFSVASRGIFERAGEEHATAANWCLTQQNPRAQSQANVLQPKRGDLLVFATRFRPVKGSKGYYRVQMKHGVSEVHGGERYTLGLIFHDALS